MYVIKIGVGRPPVGEDGYYLSDDSPPVRKEEARVYPNTEAAEYDAIHIRGYWDEPGPVTIETEAR